MRLAAERGRRIDRAFGAVAGRLDLRERAFAHELAYGTTRLRGRLDHLLSRHVHRGLGSLDPVVLEVLRLGAYQLLYMDGVPDYAAVSAAVDQVRSRAGPRPAGLVNAVLRKVGEAGDGPELYPSFRDDAATFLCNWGSHPSWLVDRWLERWSVDEVRSLVEADNRRPSVHLCPLDATPEEAAAHLEAAGLGATVVGQGTRCVRLADDVSPSAALAAVPAAVVQDPGANLVVLYSDVPPGTKVADLCAAPGGKLLAAPHRPAEALALDRSESRLHMLRDNARRAGRAVRVVVADARHPPFACAEAVLLDAPCTGTGTLSRHPDGRWRLRPDSIAEMASLQRDLIAAAASVVAPGGILVYSTCTLEPEENEDVVASLLDARPDFRIEPTGAAPAGFVDASGHLFVTPHATGFDGAFAARLRRAA